MDESSLCVSLACHMFIDRVTIWEVFHTNNWNTESHLHSWAMKMCKTLMTWFALSFQVFIPLKAHKVCEPSNFLHIQNI